MLKLKTVFLFMFLSATFYHPVCAQPNANSKEAIRMVLQAQLQAWNKGDMDGYMEGYWKNDSLRFLTRKGLVLGWTTVCNNYKKAYPDAKAMGNLNFSIVRLDEMSEQQYVMVGKWEVKKENETVSGYFTLWWKKFPEGWKIIMDHTS